MSNTKQRVTFRTERFEFSHGKAPRGRGGWIFEDRSGEHQFFARGGQTLAEAKREATEWARENGHDTLYVCP